MTHKYLLRKFSTMAGVLIALVALLLMSFSDPLPSWNEGETKRAIVDFVEAITAEGSETWVDPEERIAAFDNDGTLWAEKPVVQMMFIERYPAVRGELTLTGYRETIDNFFEGNREISCLRYLPQLELLEYLRENGFTIYLCSGGEGDFMRAVSEEYYGVPPERVIGTEFEYVFDEELNDFRRLSKVRTFNDREVKPVSIQYKIGKRPILACGNVGGKGDIEMLRFSQGGQHPSLQLIVNHDDAEREFLYGEEDDESLNRAAEHGWYVVSIKNDWKKVFADE